jgi:hypothetical protein
MFRPKPQRLLFRALRKRRQMDWALRDNTGRIRAGLRFIWIFELGTGAQALGGLCALFGGQNRVQRCWIVV